MSMHVLHKKFAGCLFVTFLLVPACGWSQCEGKHGDVNGDGHVTNLDALMVNAYFLRLISKFPADTNQDDRWPEAFCTPTPSPTSTPTPLPGELTVLLPDGVPLVMAPIPAGLFQMGSNDGGDWSWCPSCEQPVHTVTFAQPFYMGKYEVTQRQWQAVMGNNPSWFVDRPDAPVEQVSWNDCKAFITALNAHITATGQGPATFRLPSEAEWEYVCRAGTTTRFSFGNSTCAPSGCNSCDLSDFAWWCGNNSGSGQQATYGTKPAGQKLPNAWGLHDMHGNVVEWCEDDWHGNYTDAPSDGRAWVDAPRGAIRVLRGGIWSYEAGNCRSAIRYYTPPGNRNNFIGLRLARS